MGVEEGFFEGVVRVVVGEVDEVGGVVVLVLLFCLFVVRDC